MFRPIAWIVVWLCSACGGNASDDATCLDARSPGVTPASQALHGGSTAPEFIPLSEAQQRAIVVVIPGESSSRDLCSGVLVSAGLVLTAKHCQFDGHVAVRFTASDDASVVDVATSEQIPIPDLDLMVLRVPQDERLAALEVDPIPVYATALTSAWVGTLVELAGAGLSSSGALGDRGFAAEPIVALTDTWIEVDGEGASGACDGDSGGPLLGRGVDGMARVLGILSDGDRSCMGVDRFTRLDTIAQWPSDDVYGAQDRPDPDCADIDAHGLCQAGVAMRCADGLLVANDCQAAGLICAWDPRSDGVACGDSAGACGDITSSGRCEGGLARRCDEGEPVAFDCTKCGEICVRDAGTGRVGCLSPVQSPP
jgi:hypothetical protein